MLRMALNFSGKQHLTNEQLYRDLPLVSSKVRQRKLRLSGHCIRHQEEIVSHFIIWQPKFGTVNRGRRNITYVDNLLDDTGDEDMNCLKRSMVDRKIWKETVDLGEVRCSKW